MRNEGGAEKIVLAVSANAAWQQEIRSALEGSTVQVLTLDAAAEAPARAKTRQPHLLLIDEEGLNTEAGDGTKVLEALKASPYTATLPLVAVLPHAAGENTQLDFFRRGADDCLARPDSVELLRARLRALVQRYCPPGEAADKLAADGMLLDLRARKVTVSEKPVALTRKEFDLLNMLMRKRGVVVYTTHLYHSVWGYGDSSPVDAHTVKVHISSLRGKLGEPLGRKIVNLPGLGYRFDG